MGGIDQVHFVNRERSLSVDRRRIISREVITNSEIGVLADQFYAERLYTLEEITQLLKSLGFTDIHSHGNVTSESTRNQDLGMMANRLVISALCPDKPVIVKSKIKDVYPITVFLGDPKLPDTVKMGGQFNNEDLETINILKKNLDKLNHFKFEYVENHQSMLNKMISKPPKLVFNLCDEGFKNQATMELHVPALLELMSIPYTGAGPGCLSLCYNKANIRAIAASMEVDVPTETFFDPKDQAANLPSFFLH